MLRSPVKNSYTSRAIKSHTNVRFISKPVTKKRAGISQRVSRSIVTRDRSVVRCLAIRQVEQRFVDVAPAPALGRVIALDDRMRGGVKMFGGVLVGGIVAAADMAAGP